jgi:hypothetical protein
MKKVEKLKEDISKHVIADQRISQIRLTYRTLNVKEPGNKNYNKLVIAPYDSVRTTAMRSFSETGGNEILSNKDFVNYLKKDSSVFSSSFLEQPPSSKTLLLILDYLKQPGYYIIFSAVQLQTKNSDRAFNIVTTDSYYGNSEHLQFILMTKKRGTLFFNYPRRISV